MFTQSNKVKKDPVSESINLTFFHILRNFLKRIGGCANLSSIFLIWARYYLFTYFLENSSKQYILYFECVNLTYFFRILGNFLRRIGYQPVTNFPNGIWAGNNCFSKNRKQCIFYFECVDLTHFFRILGIFLRRIRCQPSLNFPNLSGQ